MPNQYKSFAHLDEVSSYAEQLLEQGYTRKGKWSLGENCNHLAIMMKFAGRFQVLFSVAQKLGMIALMVAVLRFVTGLGLRIPAFPFARPKKSVSISDADGVNRLVDAIAEHKCSVDRFQLWHCGHHLAFLEPAANRTENTSSARESFVSTT